MKQENIMMIIVTCSIAGGIYIGREFFLNLPVSAIQIAIVIGLGFLSTAVIIAVLLFCWFLVDSQIEE